MKIASVDNFIIKKMKSSGISKDMKSLESCDWIALEEKEEKIIGAAGVGGLFHVSGIQIDRDFRGIGLGKLLQGALIEEAQRRGYSFLSVFICFICYCYFCFQFNPPLIVKFFR